MAVDVGNIVRIVARLQLNGISDIINVFHFRVDVNLSVDDTAFMAEVAERLDFLYTIINASIVDNVTYIAVEGQNVTKNELLPSTAWPVLVAGLSATNMMPETVSACVFHRTLVPRVRAAKFLPPVGDGNSIEGVLSAALQIAIQSFGNTLTVGLATALISLGYVAFNRITSVATPVTQAIVPTRWRTQRRRRLGVGS